MRIATIEGRLTLLTPDGHVDIATASDGRFGPDTQTVYAVFDEFREWVSGRGGATHAADGSTTVDPVLFGSPAPAPRQVFAIGLNYRGHAAEAGVDTLPGQPTVFGKFASSITGPVTDVVLPPGRVDWEVELVAVISRTARNVDAARAWNHVAGLTVGQDLSERDMQMAGPFPQFGLAKSHPGFSPIGPVLVTPDEFDDPDDLEIGCSLDGEQLQKARTSDMIFSIPRLVAHLSTVVTLGPGDVIFTGTPAGVGVARRPARFLEPGAELVSWVEGIGQLRQRFRSPAV